MAYGVAVDGQPESMWRITTQAWRCWIGCQSCHSLCAWTTRSPDTPCVLEASPVLGTAAQWTPVFTNASPGSPFDFVDPDGNVTEQLQKFYRAHQP